MTPDVSCEDHIAVQPWMTDSASQRVLRALRAAGGHDCARFVGGCVRNAIIDRPVDDVDVATTLTPDQVTAALLEAELKAVPTGVEHGTITAVSEHRPFEITTLRRDVETDGRRAVVAFTADWREDAARRDFRLNAIYADDEGRLFDPTGAGVSDARAGRIVFVGDAPTRVREDYLRILRFFRFYAWYGRGEPDAEALSTCADLKPGLETLSVERVAKELLKLVAAADPIPALELMGQTGVLDEVLPEAQGLGRLQRLMASGLDGAGDALLRLAALLPLDADTAEAVGRRLKLSNAQRERLVGAASSMSRGLDDHDLRVMIHHHGRRAVLDRLALSWAETGDGPAPADRQAFVRQTQVQPSPFTGAQIVAAGLQPGRLVGQAQRALEAWWIDRDFAGAKAERRAALAATVARLQGGQMTEEQA